MAESKHNPASEPYLVLARKYRPERFEDVIGQEVIWRTLQNAVRLGRIHHAYLFTGPRGVGKTTMARILAKALNCESVEHPTPEPCCKCDACVRIGSGVDIDVLEIDGASNTGVDHIRELRQNAKYAPSQRRFKIYYIDEVHMLSKAAFNALLKTLEEPPPRVKFIFSTTDPQMIPETVISRCQRFDFRRIGPNDIVGYLGTICEQEGLKPEEGVLEMIAWSARGGLRDALGVLDQLAAFGDDTLKLDSVQLVIGAVRHDVVAALVDAIAAADAAQALELCHGILFQGADVIDFCNQLSEYLRDLMVARFCGTDSPVVAGSLAPDEVLKRQCRLFDPDALLYMIQLLREAKLRARRDSIGRVALELAIVKMCTLDRLVPVSDALSGLKSGGSAPTVARPGRTPAPARGPSGAGPAGGSASPSVFARMKEQLGGNKPAGPEAAPAKPPAAGLPAGMDARAFRQLQDLASSRTLADKLSEEKALLEQFVAANKSLGLVPLKIEELKRSERDKDSSFLGE